MQYLTRLGVGAKIFRTLKGGERSGQCTDIGRCLSLVLTGQGIKVCLRAIPHHRVIGSTADRGKGQYLFEIIPKSRFQASATVQMRCSSFWDVAQRH